MKSIKNEVIKCFADFDEYHQKFIIGGMIRNADFMIQSNQKAQTERVTQIHIAAEKAENDDNELLKIERIGEFLETLESQAKDLSKYRDELAAVYKHFTGEDYVSTTGDVNERKSKASKYLKKYAQA